MIPALLDVGDWALIDPSNRERPMGTPHRVTLND